MMKNDFVIFDRDGTLIDHIPYINNVESIRFKSDLIPSLQNLQSYGFKFGIISNQSAISRGLATIDDVLRINSAINDYLRKNEIEVKFSWFCPHAPSENCNCRKPRIGLGIKAKSEFAIRAHKSYVVGDSESDIVFGRDLGFKTVYINGGSANVGENYSTNQLSLAADWIIRDYTNGI